MAEKKLLLQRETTKLKKGRENSTEDSGRMLLHSRVMRVLYQTHHSQPSPFKLAECFTVEETEKIHKPKEKPLEEKLTRVMHML